MYRTLDDLGDVKGKRVLVRMDLNVPMKNGKVTDYTRIERQAPTVQELSDKGAREIVLSHFDRPGGKGVPSMSLKPLAAALADRARATRRRSPPIASDPWPKKRSPN